MDVISVTPQPSFQLLQTFANGEVRQFDMRPLLAMSRGAALQRQPCLAKFVLTTVRSYGRVRLTLRLRRFCLIRCLRPVFWLLKSVGRVSKA